MTIRWIAGVTTASALMTFIVCMPQTMMPQRFGQMDNGRMRGGSMGMYYYSSTNNEPNKQDVTFSSRSVRGRNLLNKSLSNDQNSSPKVHRYENGTLKILSGKPLRGASDTSDIVFFPGPKSDSRPKLNINPCEKGASFCENVEDYPVNRIDDVLKRTANNFQGIFGVDDTEVEIGQRIDTPQEEEQVCQSIKRIVYPQKAQNTVGDWVYVVNHKEYLQGIILETCLNEKDNVPCLYYQSYPLGRSPVCIQKHVNRKLLAVNSKNETYTDNFKMSSCCSCVVRLTHSRDARSIFINDQTPAPKRKHRI